MGADSCTGKYMTTRPDLKSYTSAFNQRNSYGFSCRKLNGLVDRQIAEGQG